MVTATLALGCSRALAAGESAAVAVGLEGVRLGGDVAATRLVLDLDGSVSGRLVAGAADGQVVIALPALLGGGPTQGRGLGLIRGWSLRSAAGGTRLVLDLAPGATTARRFLIPPAAEGGSWRYVIDVRAPAAGDGAVLAQGPVVQARSATQAQAVSTASAAPLSAPLSRFEDWRNATAGAPPTAAPVPRRPAALPVAGGAPAPRSRTVLAAVPEAPPSAPAAEARPLNLAEPQPAAGLRTPVANRYSAAGAVDLALAGGADNPRGAAPTAAALPATRVSPAAARPAVLAPRPAAGVHALVGHGLKVVVIDAGHGGHDTGARSLVRNEKDITLAAALDLKERLVRMGRYKAVLTRDSDVFIPLEERVQIARRAGADLFISLHADSAGSNPTPHGASVYTLSDHGQTRVNNVLGPHEWFAHPGGRNDAGVRQILLDLTQTTTRNRSSQFAGLLIDHISDKVDLLPRSHRDAGYFVLLAPDVPAVLLEMGFITNPGDEMRLTDPDQRDRLMGGVADAIDAYFGGGTRLAAG